MAFPKTHDYSHRKREASSFAKLLSHPERIEIIEYLLRHGPSTVKSIVRRSPLSLPTVSQHLKYLREAGLLSAYPAYPYIYYDVLEPELSKCTRNVHAILNLLADQKALTSI